MYRRMLTCVRVHSLWRHQHIAGMKFDIIGSLQSIDIARLGHQPVPQWLDHPDMLYPRRDHTLSCYQDKLFAVG